MQGLMTQLARRHDLTAVMLVDNEFDAEECRRAMQAYCRDVVLVPKPYVGEGLAKRLLQLQSLASTRSWERRLAAVPAMQRALDRVLRAKRFPGPGKGQPAAQPAWSPAGAGRRCAHRMRTPAAVHADPHPAASSLSVNAALVNRALLKPLWCGPTGRRCPLHRLLGGLEQALQPQEPPTGRRCPQPVP
jgi:hypothetical protein